MKLTKPMIHYKQFAQSPGETVSRYILKAIAYKNKGMTLKSIFLNLVLELFHLQTKPFDLIFIPRQNQRDVLRFSNKEGTPFFEFSQKLND